MGLTMYLGYELYERARTDDWFGGAEEEPVKVQGSLSYPAVVEITSLQGRDLKVRLTGRNDVQIQFERLSDGETFVYEINDLSPDSRTLVREYDNVGLSGTEALFREGKVTLESVHVEQLREAISRIDQKLEVLESRYSSSQSKTERRTIRREAEELLKEKKAYEVDIEERSL